MTLTVESSIELLLNAQTPSGAIPASTVHDVYQYGWLRDGSWCAYALHHAGHIDAASRWHHWVATTLLAHRHRFAEAMDAVRDGTVSGQVMLPALFTLLPEQVQDHVQSPYMLEYWKERWGATATPLLWSHAMHAVLSAS